MQTLPQIVAALAEALRGEDPHATGSAIAALEAALGVEVAGAVIDRLLDEEAQRLTAPMPLAERWIGPVLRPACA